MSTHKSHWFMVSIADERPVDEVRHTLYEAVVLRYPTLGGMNVTHMATVDIADDANWYSDEIPPPSKKSLIGVFLGKFLRR